MTKTIADFVVAVVQSKGFLVGFLLMVILALGYDNWTSREREFDRVNRLEDEVRQTNRQLIESYKQDEQQIRDRLYSIERQNEEILRILRAEN